MVTILWNFGFNFNSTHYYQKSKQVRITKSWNEICQLFCKPGYFFLFVRVFWVLGGGGWQDMLRPQKPMELSSSLLFLLYGQFDSKWLVFIVFFYFLIPSPLMIILLKKEFGASIGTLMCQKLSRMKTNQDLFGYNVVWQVGKC